MAAAVVAVDAAGGAPRDCPLRLLVSDPEDLQRWAPFWPVPLQGVGTIDFDRHRISACLPAGLAGRLEQPVGAISVQELRSGSLWVLLLWGLRLPEAEAVSWFDARARAGLLQELEATRPAAAVPPVSPGPPMPGGGLPLLTDSPFAMAWLSPAGAFLHGNRNLELLLGRDPAALMRCRWQEMTHPQDLGRELVLATQLLSGHRESYRLRKRFLRPAGQARWADVAVSACRAADGTLSQLLLQAIDISEAEAERQRLNQELQQLRRLADQVPDTPPVVDRSFGLRWASEAPQTWQVAVEQVLRRGERRAGVLAERTESLLLICRGGRILSHSIGLDRCLSIPADQVLGASLLELVAPEERQAQRQMLEQVERGGSLMGHTQLLGPNGQRLAVEVTMACLEEGEAAESDVCVLLNLPAVDADRGPGAADGVSSPQHDPLTGLLRRGDLFDRLDGLIRRRRRRRKRDRVGLLMCDLDQLNTLNERHGREHGDLVLEATARRLRTSTRSADLVGRLGGDELLVVLQEVHQFERAIDVAERIRQATHAPIPCPGIEAAVLPSLSIGLTLLRDDEDLDAALLRADMATHAAKASGGNQVIVMPATSPLQSLRLGTGVVRQRQRSAVASGG